MNHGQPPPLSPERFRHFRKHPFGLFLHWGLYSLQGWHEQDQWRRNWKREDYEKLQRKFAAARFDPDHWIDVAQEAGATYICLTAKHADGFCLWDSDQTDYKVTNSPMGRDVVAELAKACEKRRMALGMYYSVVDEHHPAYPHSGGRWEYPGPQPGDTPDLARYVDYVREQVTELCTRYGRLHAFWWDANPQGWQDASLNALIRELQPGVLINNRGFDAGDFGTPERDWDASVDEVPVFSQATEACQALGSQSWGYRKEEDYYTLEHLLRSIAKIHGKGGNYLLNTGPRPDGSIATDDRKLLRKIGEWRGKTLEAFEGTEPASHLLSNREVLLARGDGRTWYVILHRAQSTRSVRLQPFRDLPLRATDLVTGAAISTRNALTPDDHEHGHGWLRLFNLSKKILREPVPVIRLQFEKPQLESC